MSISSSATTSSSIPVLNDADETSSPEQGEDADMDVEDEGERSVDDIVRFPSPKDEPRKVLKLSGRNEVEYVEVDGWTHTIPLGFPGLRPDLKMKVPDIPKSTLLTYLRTAKSNGESLEQLVVSSDSSVYTPVKASLVLQVIAKKAPVVFFKDGLGDKPADVNVLGNAILADETGACLATCWNEANLVFLENVEVGDYVIISKCRSKYLDSKRFKFEMPFHSALLDVELKIDKYDVRGIQKIPNHMLDCQATKKLPSSLFRKDETTLIPSQFIKTNGSLAIPEEDHPTSSVAPSDKNSFFNLMGVITYSGRLERAESRGNCLVQCLEDSSVVITPRISKCVPIASELRSIKQFHAYRWLQIVDGNSEPLLLKLFLNPNTSGVQDKLVPGALVIITNCQIAVFSGITGSIQTSVFSQVYVNADYERYFGLMPAQQLINCRRLLNLDSLKKLYKRNDINWSVGWTYPVTITDEQTFCDGYLSKVSCESQAFWSVNGPPKHVFARRENFTLVVKGKVYAALVVTKESSQYHLPPKYSLHKELFDTQNTYSSYKKIVNYVNCLCKKCDLLHWHSSRRNVSPPQIPKAVKTLTVATLLDEVVRKNENICAPFLFPSKYQPMPVNALPAIARMPKLDDEPFLLVYIVDDDHQVAYKTVWKGLPFNEMKTKLLETGTEKEILALVEIFCCESQEVDGLEVLLKDFVLFSDTSSDDEVNVT